MSERCGHCLHIQGCWTRAQITECSEMAARSPCPVCGERVRFEDIVAVVLSEQAATFQSMPWKDAVNVPVEAFSAFQGSGVEVPAFRTGKFADALRGQIQGEARKARRKEYEAVSKAFAPYLAGRRAAKAASRGDLATAIPLYEQALAVDKDPAARAALQASLAFCLVTTGDLRRAAPLLRDAAAYTGERPAEQRMVASATAYQFGFLLSERGDLTGGQSAYQLAMEFGDPAWASKAAVNLGILADQEGRPDEALALAEYGYQHGEGETRLMAAYNIGWFCEGLGKHGRARKFYRIALASQDSEVRERAESGLHRLGPAGRFGRR